MRGGLRAAVAAIGCGGLAGLSACAGTAGGPQAADAPRTGMSFERVVAPFPVFGADGLPYEHPFLGGLDVPRPQFLDIDADGDPDLFLQERTGELMHFENVGTPQAPRFEWRSDRYHDLEIGEWSRFHDFDGDGDFDLLAETQFSYVRYYRNDGTAAVPAFVLQTDSVRTASGEALFSDRQNIPAIVDLDCDGRLDLFLGRVDGTVMRYEGEGDSGGGLPNFGLVAERFEDIEIVGQLGTRHGANALRFSDVDGDGDPDLLWGDYFEPSLLFIENTGSCSRPSLRSDPVLFEVADGDSLVTSGYNAAEPVDLNGDGEGDLLVGVLGGAFNPNRTASDNLWYYERVPGRGYVLRTQRLLRGIDAGSESIPVVVDWDADGDLDLLVSNKLAPSDLNASRLLYFENRGSATAPELHLADTLDLGRVFHYAPALGDLDGDGDLDMILGNWTRNLHLLWNEGTRAAPRYALADSAFISLTRGSNAAPALGDLDGDGDLDLLVGEGSGALNYYENTGSATSPQFTLVSDEYGGIDPGRRSFPSLADIDGDGDLDLLLGRESGGAELYRNAGASGPPRFERDVGFTLDLPPVSTPVMADFDGDGRLDVVAGGTAGGIRLLLGR